ncbi:uncharacterized protein EAF02_010910 [Botrytis sinoallii]|uniref:uncharacterized protein n=1 Tax=Botrytis sinoallii TaxID=1463999 RepID=UPI001900F567|nr:uncharacterized protein EAF02_010910 [Botrytis sinoallii]KAF7859462.1 hypothetical protein EAF02_010910 [Botrytis sinoallii]
MGYSEIPCQICGVSFNIGRDRTPDEIDDESASWYNPDGGYKAGEENCGTEYGCLFYRTALIPEQNGEHNMQNNLPFYEDNTPMVEDDNLSYSYESASDDEPLEYDSDSDGGSSKDHVLEASSTIEDRQDAQIGSEMEVDDYDGDGNLDSDEETKLYHEWLSKFDQHKLPNPPRVEKIMMTNEEAQSVQWENKFTHLPGPKCSGSKAYNGNLITAQEMRGCTTAQCLVYKDHDWSPSPDDEDFELEGDVFLSGLGDHVPSRDMGYVVLAPARHGLDSDVLADTMIWQVPPNTQEVAMPFHPTCLEVYKHASRLSFNQTSIQDLMKWRDKESCYRYDTNFPRDRAVRHCSEQWWNHSLGTEWLAANPVFIPALRSVFQSAITTNSHFSLSSPAFPIRPSKPRPRRSPRNDYRDPFLKLSQELQDEIILYLLSKDIASIRLVSRAFTQLSQGFFYKLVVSEMPWLWEIYDFTPPSFWATVSGADLKSREKRRTEHNEQLVALRSLIWEELPELYDEWKAAEPVFDEKIEGALKTGFEDGVNTKKLDWYQLYLGITKGFKEGRLKGLQNRERIWKDVEEIIRRIKKYEETG